MQIKTKKGEILRALGRVEKAVSGKSPLPILSGIKFSTSENGLTLTATDLELTMQTTAEVEVLRDGGIVLPARYVVELFKKMPDTDITITSDTGKASIIYGNAETSLNGYSESDFPELPAITDEKTFSIPGSLLKKGINRVSYASSKDLSRPIFCGTLFEIENGVLNLVATDTFRMAKQELPMESAENCTFVVPTKALNEVSKLIKDDIEIKISVGLRQAVFAVGNTTVISRLVEGRFPNYKQVIPEAYKARFTANTRDLYNAADRSVLLFGSDANPTTTISVNGKLLVAARTASGNILEEVPAEIEGLNGEEMVSVMNSRFLLECLKVANDVEKVTFGLTGPLSPCVVKPVGEDAYLSIIVPVKVNS